jgi:hypothetical protein
MDLLILGLEWEEERQMNYNDVSNIPKEKLKFVECNEKIHDVKFETKPIGYLKDAFIRFTKNRGSIVAAIIILILFLYAIITPLFAKYKMSENDIFYSNMPPRHDFFAKFGFWDGLEKREVKQFYYDYYSGIPGAITKLIETKEVDDGFRKSKVYVIEFDRYAGVGYFYDFVT